MKNSIEFKKKIDTHVKTLRKHNLFLNIFGIHQEISEELTQGHKIKLHIFLFFSNMEKC